MARCWRASPGSRRSRLARPIAVEILVRSSPSMSRKRIIVSRPSLLAEGRGGALGHDPALAQDHHAVGEVLGLLHVVGGEHDRGAQLLEPLDHVPGLAAGRGVEARRRLVEEEQLGVADDPDADVEPPLLAARERADRVRRGGPEARPAPASRRRSAAWGRSSHRASSSPSTVSSGLSSHSCRTRPIRVRHSRVGVVRDRCRGRRRRRRSAAGSPRGSRWSSSCPPRSARGSRTPRRGRPRSRSP